MNAPNRRTQAERSAATQKRLLNATIECILEQGLSRTTTRLVCQRARVSRGAQLHHFPTRERLLASTAWHLLSLRHREFKLSHAGPLNDREAIAAAADFLWSIYSGPTLKVWQELVVAARTDAALRELLVEVNSQFTEEAVQTFAGLFPHREADEAELAAAARLTLSVLDGLALNQTLERDEVGARQVLQLLERMAHAWAR